MPSPSCDQCHRRRLQCLGGKPACDHCAATGQICTYSTGKPVGKPKGHRKIKRNTSTDLHPSNTAGNTLAPGTLDSTTSDSSPNYSDLNDIGSASHIRMRSDTATTSSPWPPDLIPTTLAVEHNSPTSTFTSPNNSSPGVEFNNMRITGNFDPYPQPTNLEPVYFTTGVPAGPVPPKTILPQDPNSLGWPTMVESPSAMQFPLGMTSAPFFDPSTATGPQPPLLQPSFIFPHHEADGTFHPNAIPNHQWTHHPPPACDICHQLPTAIASVFTCNFTLPNEFDTMLSSVHNLLELAQKCMGCPQCVIMEERHPMMFIMVLHHVIVCFQRMTSIVGSDKAGIFRKDHSSLETTYPSKTSGLEKETADMEKSVKSSVLQMELGRLRELAENVKFFALGRKGEHPSNEVLMAAFDEAFGVLQETVASLQR